MNTQDHILTDFNTALKELRDKTITIGNLTIANTENAMSGLLNRDIDLCNKVIADDEDVNQLELEIDSLGLTIMSKYHPFASDLRLVLSSMKVTHNLERISDHAENIAKLARKIAKNSEVLEVALLEPLFRCGRDMLKTAMTAYADNSLELAKEVIDKEEELLVIQKKAYKTLVSKLEDPGENHKTYINLIFITRWLERLGGLSVNIAEDVVFMKSSVDIRHGGDIEEEGPVEAQSLAESGQSPNVNDDRLR